MKNLIPFELEQILIKTPKIALAFSGGVDSSYLLYASTICGIDIQPYYVKSSFQPDFELEDAKKIVAELNLKIKIIEIDILKKTSIISNPINRCYYCKKTIMESILKEAKKDGYNILIDGSNASDIIEDRPGMHTLIELNISSPLRDSGLTKDNIRNLSKKAKLFTWNKPSYSCLATRIPTNTTITPDLLEKIELSENILFDMGFINFRIRVLGDNAKLEFTNEQIFDAFTKREMILSKLSLFFNSVMIDLKTRQ